MSMIRKEKLKKNCYSYVNTEWKYCKSPTKINELYMQNKLRLYKSLIVLHSFIFAFYIENLWCTGLFFWRFFPSLWILFNSIHFNSLDFLFHFICFPEIFFFFSFLILGSLTFVSLCHIRFDLSNDLALYQNNHSYNNSRKQTASTLPFVYTFSSFITSSWLFFTFSLLQQHFFSVYVVVIGYYRRCCHFDLKKIYTECVHSAHSAPCIVYKDCLFGEFS